MTTQQLENRLINHVHLVLKSIRKKVINSKKIKVSYDFNWRGADSTECRANIFVPTDNTETGNGHERMYGWDFMQELVNLSDKHGISWCVGHTDNIELCIQIYVN